MALRQVRNPWYEILSTEAMQDSWTVETRKRLKGKLQGQSYKVFRDGAGKPYYTVKAALAAGFAGYVDGTVPTPKERARVSPANPGACKGAGPKGAKGTGKAKGVKKKRKGLKKGLGVKKKGT